MVFNSVGKISEGLPEKQVKNGAVGLPQKRTGTNARIQFTYTYYKV